MSKSDFTWRMPRSFAVSHSPPDELSRRLRLKPTKVLSIGDPIMPGSRRLAQLTLRKRQTREWKGNTVDVHASHHLRGLSRFVDEMRKHRKVIARAVPPSEFYFYSVLFTNSPNACVGLPLDLARQIASLSAEWTCSVWSGVPPVGASPPGD